MEPITTALVASALGEGLRYLGEQLVDTTFLDPVLDPVAEKLRGLLPGLRKGDDKALQTAVESALQATGAPAAADQIEQYILTVGFDQFVAAGNLALRQEMARSVLLLTRPDAALIPDALLRSIRWPSSQRQMLADFLYQVRYRLAGHADYTALIEYADRAESQILLRRMTIDLAQTGASQKSGKDQAELTAALRRDQRSLNKTERSASMACAPGRLHCMPACFMRS